MAISSSKQTPAVMQISSAEDQERPKSSDGAKRDMWSSMLDNVANGKRLPEKNILVLGGSSDLQREFLEALSIGTSVKRAQDRHGSRQPPMANSFALGYTYYDVLDADQEDILARLSMYLLADPSPSFAPLLKPLLTPQTIPNTLVVILLDWTQPWLWIKQLKDWVNLLRSLVISLDEKCRKKMEEVMVSWRGRGRGATVVDNGGIDTVPDSDITLPLGPGEWDEALGLPLCVVCQNSNQMERLEREKGWKEEDFDFVLQFLRTVLLKHGASLIYTIPSVQGPLQSLIHSSLGVQSLLKRQPLRHNVIERDKVILPPNWDSWGKIRVLREGFDVEGVSQGWSTDVGEKVSPINDAIEPSSQDQRNEGPKSAMILYEKTIRALGFDSSIPKGNRNNHELEVKHMDPQEFLATQLEYLDRIKHVAVATGNDKKPDVPERDLSLSQVDSGGRTNILELGRVAEHIGPVQFNMGGIQVDADDMLQRLKDRQNHVISTPEPSSGQSIGDKFSNESTASFFAELLAKRERPGAVTTPKPTPKPRK